MGDSVKCLTEVKVENVYYSPFIYLTTHFITEVYQVFQAQFLLHKLMLMTLKHIFALHAPGNGFQDELLHHLPRDQGETGL